MNQEKSLQHHASQTLVGGFTLFSSQAKSCVIREVRREEEDSKAAKNKKERASCEMELLYFVAHVIAYPVL